MIGDIWTDIPPLNAQPRSASVTPPRNPFALLEPIPSASSNPGDLVARPFLRLAVILPVPGRREGAQLDRHRVTYRAIGPDRKSAARKRTSKACTYTNHGVPRDLLRRRADLAPPGQGRPRATTYEFEKWSVALLSGQPTKRSGDGGIDGNLYFGKNRPRHHRGEIGQGGHPPDARLRGAMERHRPRSASSSPSIPPTRAWWPRPPPRASTMKRASPPSPASRSSRGGGFAAARPRVRLPPAATMPSIARPRGRPAAAQGTLDF